MHMDGNLLRILNYSKFNVHICNLYFFRTRMTNVNNTDLKTAIDLMLLLKLHHKYLKNSRKNVINTYFIDKITQTLHYTLSNSHSQIMCIILNPNPLQPNWYRRI